MLPIFQKIRSQVAASEMGKIIAQKKREMERKQEQEICIAASNTVPYLHNETRHLQPPERECEIDPSQCLYGCLHKHRGRAAGIMCVGEVFCEYMGWSEERESQLIERKTEILLLLIVFYHAMCGGYNKIIGKYKLLFWEWCLHSCEFQFSFFLHNWPKRAIRAMIQLYL